MTILTKQERIWVVLDAIEDFMYEKISYENTRRHSDWSNSDALNTARNRLEKALEEIL